MSEDGYRERLSDAVEGLAWIAWMDRAARCADPRRPTMAEMFPTEAEGQAVVEVLVMADTLAAGCPSQAKPGKPSALAAVAKAMVMLSLAPGGVPFLGRRYQTFEVGTVARFEVGLDHGIGQVQKTLREHFDVAMEFLRKAARGEASIGCTCAGSQDPSDRARCPRHGP